MNLKEVIQKFFLQSIRHYKFVVAIAAFVCLILVINYFEARQHTAISEIASTTGEVVTNNGFQASVPTRLRIPAIDLDVDTFETLGLMEDQTIEVPESYDTVGWYKYGPTPGEIGPSVILGHVDSYEGPAVFWSLGQLEEGDEIFVDRADGTTATFTVSLLERHEQAAFPTREVYGDIDHAGLRLITCTGVYDHNTLRYSHNLIVFAKLATSSEKSSE